MFFLSIGFKVREWKWIESHVFGENDFFDEKLIGIDGTNHMTRYDHRVLHAACKHINFIYRHWTFYVRV